MSPFSNPRLLTAWIVYTRIFLPFGLVLVPGESWPSGELGRVFLVGRFCSLEGLTIGG